MNPIDLDGFETVPPENRPPPLVRPLPRRPAGTPIQITEHVQTFVIDLIRRFPEIAGIWLFGSRAEGIERPDSDWDLIACSGNRLTPETVAAAAQQFDVEGFDLFIAKGDDFVRPWPDRAKSGSFSRWKWKPKSEDCAAYNASADPDKPDRTSGRQRAIRLWSRAGGWSALVSLPRSP